MDEGGRRNRETEGEVVKEEGEVAKKEGEVAKEEGVSVVRDEEWQVNYIYMYI